MKKIVLVLVFASMLFGKEFLVGVGGFDCYKSGDRYFVDDNKSKKKSWCSISEALEVKAPNVNSVSIWITKDWDNSWFRAKTVNENLVDKGYIPVFIFYWFRDDISVKFVKKNKKAYFKALDKFVEYLKEIKGKKIVVLNPEFNQKDIPSWVGFNDILIKSIQKVKKVKNVEVGFCVGDFGNYNKVNEPNEWKLFHPSIKKAIKYADFLASQEMRALTRNKPHHLLNTPYRALAFSRYLYKKYQKPIFLAYTAISSYGENGKYIHKEILKSFADLMPLFKTHSNLIGWNFFHFWDMPKQVGYFKEAEKFFGVISKEGVDKESLKYLKEIR